MSTSAPFLGEPLPVEFMAAHTYPMMMDEIASGLLRPDRLIRDRIGLDEVPARLAALGVAGQGAGGITIIRP